MEKTELERDFSHVRRIVVKVGSRTITHRTGKLNLAKMEKIVRQLADLQNQGREILLVTSGAQAAGLGKLGFDRKPRTIPEKQATSAVGQGILMHMYEKLFSEYGCVVAQVLLTREDVTDRKRFLNARNALKSLLNLGVIPIINENDTVAVEEIKFGDNDTLSALVGSLVEADLLILLSDIEGLYTADPRKDKNAALIPQVTEITPEIESLAGGAGTEFATGGMETKLIAGKIAMNSGLAMVIAYGAKENVIQRIVAGQPIGTLFLARENPLQRRKQWIAYGASVQGRITVDSGAQKALLDQGKSLLPSGVTAVEGCFVIGGTISVVDQKGNEIARGITNYSAEDIAKIKGVKTKEIEKVLGFKDYDEIIHRDNLVLSR